MTVQELIDRLRQNYPNAEVISVKFGVESKPIVSVSGDPEYCCLYVTTEPPKRRRWWRPGR